MIEPLRQDALRQNMADARKASSADQMVADADQSAAKPNSHAKSQKAPMSPAVTPAMRTPHGTKDSVLFPDM